MTWTVYQPGSLGTVLCWHVGHVARELAAMSPGWTVLGSSDPQAPATVRPVGRVVLVGYSLGCVGLRETMRGAITAPDAVVTIDGTHSQKAKGAPVHPQHHDLWRALAERARRGEILWLATTLGSHRYTERLPGAQAFASTAKVLETALDLAPGSLRTPQAIDQGSLHVRSYASADMDAPAHAAQVREALPALWREVVVPWLGTDATATPPSEPHGHMLPARRLGLRALDVAREHLGVRERPGPANEPQVLAYHYAARRGGSPVAGILDATGTRLGLNADAYAWCASFASYCLALAIDGTDDADRAACPHGYRCSVAELVADARARGTWWDDSGGYVPEPGDLAIWMRAGGDPRRGGTGHVSRVELYDRVSGTITTIGGNEGDEVRRSTHRDNDPNLVGWIAYP